MPGEKRFTRIPPESTGDRIHMQHTAVVFYENRTDGSYVWRSGDHYTIQGNGGSTMMVHVHGVRDNGPDGALYIHFSKLDTFNNIYPIAGQDIYDPDTQAVIAQVESYYDLYVPVNQISGWDNPEYSLNVDRFGAGYVRFTEGPAELTAWGHLKVSDTNILANYDFTKSSLPAEFSNTLVGAGQTAWDSNFNAVTLSVGDTLNDTATHTSNLYHPVSLGGTTSFVMAARVGDTGFSGLLRAWGAFDAEDGFFFKLDGTALSVVHRRTFSGVPTDVTIAQSNWNKDSLDGTGPSGMTLDVSKNNTYWIDCQHLGGGRIRWGVYYLGERITAHEMYMENKALHNAVGNPARPICWMQMCETAGGYTGTKTLYAYGAGVFSDGADKLVANAPIRFVNESYTIPASATGTYLAFSMRPAATVNGLENHTLYLPKSLQIAAWDNVDSNIDRKVEVRVYDKCILRDPDWQGETYSTVEVDTAGEHLSHGPQMLETIVHGKDTIDLEAIFKGIQHGTLRVNAERASATRSQPIAAISIASPAQVTIKEHPVWGNAKHFFSDKQAIQVLGVSATGPDSLNGNTYYLALLSGDDAHLYNSEADIESDRTPRVINVADATNISVGEVATINGTYTADVVDVTGTAITVHNRSNAAIEVGMSGDSLTTPGGGNTTVTSVTADGAGRDYDTTLLAIDGSGWPNAASNGKLEGTPPAQNYWSFMVRALSAQTNEVKTNWVVNFRELAQ